MTHMVQYISPLYTRNKAHNTTRMRPHSSTLGRRVPSSTSGSHSVPHSDIYITPSALQQASPNLHTKPNPLNRPLLTFILNLILSTDLLLASIPGISASLILLYLGIPSLTIMLPCYPEIPAPRPLATSPQPDTPTSTSAY